MKARCPSCGCDLKARLERDDELVLEVVPFVPIDVGDIVASPSARNIPMTVESYDGSVFSCVWFREGSDGTWSGPYRMKFTRDDLTRLTSTRDHQR